MKQVAGIILMGYTILPGCSWFERNDHERITRNYEVGWNDLVQDRNISKSIKGCSGCYETIIGGYIYAVGHNDDFIIAKQHPGGDTATTYYCIIDINKSEKYGIEKGVYAFASKSAFDNLRNKLKIAQIPFDMTYCEYPQ